MGTNNSKKNNRCFVIMPFSSPQGYEDGHFKRIYEQIIKPAVENAGFKPERVDENVLSTDIVTKIFQGLTECDMAICDLSSRNPNVLYELGIRQAYNMPVLLIKDEKTKDIFDVGGLTTLPYNSNRLYENVVEARNKICEALKEHDKNSESVVNIIKGRLGSGFQASEIPTSEGMDNDDRILNLLKSLIDDVDSIKQQINSEYIGLRNNSSIDTYHRLKMIENNLIELKIQGVSVNTLVKINNLLNGIKMRLENEYITIDEVLNLEEQFFDIMAMAKNETPEIISRNPILNNNKI